MDKEKKQKKFKIVVDGLEIYDQDISQNPPLMRLWTFDTLYLFIHQLNGQQISLNKLKVIDSKGSEINFRECQEWKAIIEWEKKALKEFTDLQVLNIDKLRNMPYTWCMKQQQQRRIVDLMATECVRCPFYIVGRGRSSMTLCDPL